MLMASALAVSLLSGAAPASPRPADGQAALDRLVASVWCNQLLPSDPNFGAFGDYTAWELRADGTYRFDFFTDTDPWPHGEGRWNLVSGAEGFVVVLDGRGRRRLELKDDGTIEIDGQSLRSCRVTGATPRPFDSLPAAPIPESVRALLAGLTRFPWMRTNDLDLGWRPTSVVFAPDWTYVTTYRDGACRNTGTWTPEGRGVRGYAPRHPCDARDHSHGEQFPAQLLSPNELLVNGDLYVPSASLPKRGVIWRLVGHENSVSVRVEYPRPLRRGRAATFTFDFRNDSGEDLLLERVALNSTFRDYRYKTRGMDVPEIAGLDLGRKRLAPGESYQATLDATFAVAEPSIVYFDVLVAGSTQTWDLREAHELRTAP